jgi:hypothetical protein
MRSRGCCCEPRSESLDGVSAIGAQRRWWCRLTDYYTRIESRISVRSAESSALRLVGEQLDPDPSSCARGLILVPYAPEAPWWRLTRHFTSLHTTSSWRLTSC